MGKKGLYHMGPMEDPNGINDQILPIWVPYIHVCWVTTDPDQALVNVALIRIFKVCSNMYEFLKTMLTIKKYITIVEK